jgi:lauroyl/myristoyl acyltransferase
MMLFDTEVARARDFDTVTLLQHEIRVPKGIAWLAKRTGAAVVPVTIASNRLGSYRIEIHPPVADGAPARGLAAVLEHEILARPETWLKWKDFHTMVVPEAHHA